MDGHAAAMALFASQIILEFDMVVDHLASETEEEGGLGPDTALLKLRVSRQRVVVLFTLQFSNFLACSPTYCRWDAIRGRSQQVYYEGIKGDSSCLEIPSIQVRGILPTFIRIDLFRHSKRIISDTSSSAARMESNGIPGKVQISQEMADCLKSDGKAEWYTPREDKIVAKGKGELNTYWLNYDLIGNLNLNKNQATVPTSKNRNNNVQGEEQDASSNDPESKKNASGDGQNQSQPFQSPLKTPKISNQVKNPPKKQDSAPSRPNRQSVLHTHDEEPLLQNVQAQRRRSDQLQGMPSMWLGLETDLAEPEQRLAEWNFQQLELLVKKIKANYTASQMDSSDWGNDGWGEDTLQYEEFDGTVLDELNATTDSNLIPTSSRITVKHQGVVLPAPVVLELQQFCKALGANFQKQPFHNFQHACHMTRSLVILMENLERQNSFSILSKDPMAQFVILLTCMVQDVDNPGVTNEELMKEDEEMAEYFHNTCLIREFLVLLCHLTVNLLVKFPTTPSFFCTEQNALDVAWELLVGPTCENLLRAICCHSAMELERFRKYMLHAMIATDREDKALAQQRFERWMRWNNPNAGTKQKKITWQQSIAVIEQCAQLSNLIHAVQTQETFAKWNERYFREQYLAYIQGRRHADPCETFFQQQLELLKRSVLPLAERFQRHTSNGVMGSCDELHLQATNNLHIWRTRGEEELKRMAKDAEYEFGARQLDGSIKHGGAGA